jgi:predicted MFS family arabinose efflux permease
MAIELSGVSQLTKDADRTKLIAWYNLFGSFSSAFGALFCGWLYSYLRSIKYNETISSDTSPLLRESIYEFDSLSAHRIVLIIYSICQIVKMSLFCLLSPAIEVPQATVKKTNPVALFLGLHKSKGIVLQLSCLFIIDSFAGAFVLQSMSSAWFANTYGTKESVLGSMIFVCCIVAGISALFAAKLADQIGLVLTMAVTHLPSNIFLILVPLMPNETLSITMLCLRYTISQMDVPTRNAYVQGVVDPDERSAANGVTNVVRSLG